MMGTRRCQPSRNPPADGTRFCGDEARYRVEIPLEQVRSKFSTKFGLEPKLLEKTGEMENETAA